MMKYMLITNDPEAASYAESCGVARIFVDLERLGKLERQGHLDTLISQHSMTDVSAIRSRLTEAELLVRLNPLHEGSEAEVNAAIEAGADLLMLPMFRSASEVESFCQLVDSRAAVVPLVETKSAVDALPDVVKVPGVREIYIGLNDLHLDMGLTFMFEPLASGLVDEMVSIIKAAGLPFGFGGIARVGEGIVPGEMVLAEHLRLGSECVILSRTFHRKSENLNDLSANLNLKIELDKLFEAERTLAVRDDLSCAQDQACFKEAVENFVMQKVTQA